MTQHITTTLSIEELIEAMRPMIREEIQRRFDRMVSRKEVAELWGCTVQTVDAADRKEEITRINLPNGLVRYSLNEVMGSKRMKL